MTRLRTWGALALGAVVWLPAAGSVGAGTAETALVEPVTVMTRNVFLGTDLFPVLEAADAGGFDRVARATHQARVQVDSTDFGRRAGLIADEVVAHEPDLIGLQEVALWRSGPLQPDAVGVSNAARIDYDFLSTLLDALTRRGAAYRPVVVVDEVDIESPSLGPDGALPRDVRVTLRDVILLREDAGLELLGSGSGHFRAQKRMPAPGRMVEFTRGYGWVDVRRGGSALRFVNTHLEVGDPRIGHAQARELVTGPAGVEQQPVVLACDCNSDPTRPLRSLPYRVFRSEGFVDQWLTLPRRGPGHTCCVPNTLRGSDSSALDRRVDFVFARATRQVRAESGAVLGAPVTDADLRPSDHAGVVVRIRSVRR